MAKSVVTKMGTIHPSAFLQAQPKILRAPEALHFFNAQGLQQLVGVERTLRQVIERFGGRNEVLPILERGIGRYYGRWLAAVT